MEEGDRFPYALEVGWDLQTLAELASLAPGGGVFLVDCGRESMGRRFMRSIEVRRCLHPTGRVSRRQCFLYGKVRAKWQRNILSMRWVSLEAASAILLYMPAMRCTKE